MLPLLGLDYILRSEQSCHAYSTVWSSNGAFSGLGLMVQDRGYIGKGEQMEVPDIST